MPPINFRTNNLRRQIEAAEASAKQKAALDASLAYRDAETLVGTDYQPLDSDLTAIAALAPANDTIIQRKSGAWTARTPAQVKTDLSLSKSDVGLGNVDNTSDASKPVSTAQQTAIDGKLNTWVSAPSTASDTGTAGQIAYDSSYIYVCVATDTWVRAALSTW